MDYVQSNSLLDTDELVSNLKDSNLKIIDGTSYLPGMSNTSPDENFKASHIPGAIYFDINRIADSNSELPHMIPSSQKFADEVGKLGITNTNRIVVYDRNGGYMSACRVWWMFRLFGFENIAVLNGGFPKWLEAGLPIEHGQADIQPQVFTTTKNPEMVRSFKQLLSNIEIKKEVVVDARSAGRFFGEEEEPRPGLSLGHIPGSINLPFSRLMDPKNSFVFRSADEIKQAFLYAGIEKDKPVVATCGSGVTACVIAFAMHLVGYTACSVYDGSWAEWGSQSNAPIATRE